MSHNLQLLLFIERAHRSRICQFCCSLSADLTLGPIAECDIEKVNTVWPSRHKGSMFYLNRLAKYNANVGVRTANGELVAWSLR